ncbi:hypothetical protein JX580_01380 [Thiomicrospira microaerophila]|uniref:hypothetical protein n=1 Tax=Thiomicrospira microaerophila TaxID=406020 RepID=UPI00200E5344|nr:hypothetical protein [Thiomicrospira microaerophila]UQB42574.1 hypothetical protein JX580_01380 [Thiomicrospira microaerophila]
MSSNKPEYIRFKHYTQKELKIDMEPVSYVKTQKITLGTFTFKTQDFTNWLSPGGFHREYQNAFKEWLTNALEIKGATLDLPDEASTRLNVNSFISFALKNRIDGIVYCPECDKEYKVSKLRTTIEGLTTVDESAFCIHNHLLFQGTVMHTSFKEGKEKGIKRTTRLACS